MTAMRGRRNIEGAAGFTLLELMLALSILALVLAMLAESFNVVGHGKIHAEARLDANQAGRALMAQLSQEICGAVRAVPNTPNAQPNMLLIGTGHMQSGSAIDGLTISTLGGGHHRSVFGFGAEELISYSAQPNPGHRGWFLLTRTQQSALVPPQGGFQPVSMVLADNVLALHIRYFDGQIWNESWNSQDNSSPLPLPEAISIDLQMAGGGGRPLDFSTQVTVPMSPQLQQR